METLIREVGCTVLMCVIVACPVYFTLILAFPWDGDREKIMSFAKKLLIILCIVYFCWMFSLCM